jgi:uncharacterized RDD family membrane protein YckC
MTSDISIAPIAAPSGDLPGDLPFSGFWRRFAACMVDSLVLGCLGYLLGLMFHDRFMALGPWGRLVGFVLAWPYMGLLGSRLGQGQTLGKRLLGIRVVGLDGALLSPARSLCRAALLCLPWFLNGAGFTAELLSSPLWVGLLSLIIFGLGFGQLYLLVFNRPSRRSLHDWAVGSVVVRLPLAEAAVLGGPIWRGHQVVLGLLAAAAVGVPLWMQHGSVLESFAPILAMQATALDQPGVSQAGVTQGTSWTNSTREGQHSSTQIVVNLVVNGPDVDAKALADSTAAALLKKHPQASEVDVLAIFVAKGYDIGIASYWESQQVTLSPAQWRERLAR